MKRSGRSFFSAEVMCHCEQPEDEASSESCVGHMDKPRYSYRVAHTMLFTANTACTLGVVYLLVRYVLVFSTTMCY